MKKKIKIFILTTFVLVFPISSFGQLGIRAGVNMANEIRSFNNESIVAAFNNDNLTGYNVGLVYQFNPKQTGLGLELGALLSQKGSVFRIDNSKVVNSIIKGYHEINYVDVPLNIRFRLDIGSAISFFASGGAYGSYALNGKTVFESDIVADISKSDSFDDFMSRIDYGYSVGAGIEFIRKIQLSAGWSEGLQKKDATKSLLEQINNETGNSVPNLTSKSNSRVFTVSLTYLF